jgi:2-oxo-4-hydroxy-4-carboxy-5-ureidoimidazoline decarboxylase
MTLHDLNTLPVLQRSEELSKCCGSTEWVKKMMDHFPFEDMVDLLETAEEQWFVCSEADWKEAFSHHPKIGAKEDTNKNMAATAAWAKDEQAGMTSASQEVTDSIRQANEEYQIKFGYIFIVCASGMKAEEMLAMLQVRLKNSPEVEIEVAADEQNKITKLRIEKLLA